MQAGAECRHSWLSRCESCKANRRCRWIGFRQTNRGRRGSSPHRCFSERVLGVKGLLRKWNKRLTRPRAATKIIFAGPTQRGFGGCNNDKNPGNRNTRENACVHSTSDCLLSRNQPCRFLGFRPSRNDWAATANPCLGQICPAGQASASSRQRRRWPTPRACRRESPSPSSTAESHRPNYCPDGDGPTASNLWKTAGSATSRPTPIRPRAWKSPAR